MVVDPFSIVGAIGTAAGLLGFLVSTIEKVVITGSTIKHARHIRDGLRLSLEVSGHVLDLWSKTWCLDGSTFSSEEQMDRLRSLWGEAGYAKIEDRKLSIRYQTDRIIDLLYGSGWHAEHSESAKARWGELLDIQMQRKPGDPITHEVPVDSQSLSLYRRVATALGDGTLLKSAVSELRSSIEDLKIESLWYWQTTHPHSNKHSVPSHGELEATLRRGTRAQRLSKSMALAYEVSRQDDSSGWALLFPHFEKPDVCQLECDDSLELNFLAYRPGGCQEGSECKRLAATFHLDLDDEIT
ncbi:hypothetical protein LTR10_000294 [Elasticomyces elasticus]|nr:hypothetical protein LTR10_000294 [Elasticomyces elasticus]